jgi:hypothetical protein
MLDQGRGIELSADISIRQVRVLVSLLLTGGSVVACTQGHGLSVGTHFSKGNLLKAHVVKRSGEILAALERGDH